jgi:CxxC motif-containing protein (DUF1111 family)
MIRKIAPVAAVAMFATLACAGESVPDLDAGRAVAAVPGEPLPGLTADERARFAAGREIFHHEFTAAEGLGPLYNQKRCSSCHDLPALGGFGAEPVFKATRWDASTGQCDLLTAHGGDVIQSQVTDTLRALGIEPEAVPEGTTAFGQIKPPALFAAGLLDAIPDEEIMSREDPDDLDGDGISGRAGRTSDGRIGRFGRRLEFATLHDFVAGALVLEMGLTTAEHPVEELRNGQPLPEGTDPAADPEIDAGTLALLVDFVRYLAAPASEPPSEALADTLRAGRRAFDDAQCGLCHTPTMTTGSNPVPALDRKTVALYSDLLLHDLWPDVAGICGPGTGPAEFRTAPLIGLGFRQPYLHDERAETLDDAILAHGGEAESSRSVYEGLTDAERAALLRFLRSL